MYTSMEAPFGFPNDFAALETFPRCRSSVWSPSPLVTSKSSWPFQSTNRQTNRLGSSLVRQTKWLPNFGVQKPNRSQPTKITHRMPLESCTALVMMLLALVKLVLSSCATVTTNSQRNNQQQDFYLPSFPEIQFPFQTHISSFLTENKLRFTLRKADAN